VFHAGESDRKALDLKGSTHRMTGSMIAPIWAYFVGCPPKLLAILGGDFRSTAQKHQVCDREASTQSVGSDYRGDEATRTRRVVETAHGSIVGKAYKSEAVRRRQRSKSWRNQALSTWRDDCVNIEIRNSQ